MNDLTELDAAAVASRDARERLLTTAHELQQRLEPTRLLDDAVSGVRTSAADVAQKTGNAVRRRPELAAGAAVATILLLARRPIGRALGRLFARRRDDEDDD